MFTKTDSQLSLFDVKNVFPDTLPKDDWSYIYRDIIYSLIHICCTKKGIKAS